MSWSEHLPGVRSAFADECSIARTCAGCEPPTLALPDATVVRALFSAIMSAGPHAADLGWRASGSTMLKVQRVGMDFVQIGLEGCSSEAARSQVQAVSPLSLDVLAFLLAAPDVEARAGARVFRASEVLNGKGRRRWGDERRALEVQVGAELQRLRGLVLGRTAEVMFQLSPLGGSQCDFVYEPRPWLQQLWASSARRSVDRRLIQFDHRTNRGPDVLAKKLGIYFSLLEKDAGVTRSVRSVLKAIGVAHEALASRTGRGGRLADRFEEALLRLREQELFAVRYSGSEQVLSSDEHVKGWVRRWLERDLVITRGERAAPSRAL